MKRTSILASSFVVVFVAALSAARAQDPATEARKETLAAVTRLLRDADSYAAFEFVQASGTPAEVAARYGAVVGDLYWAKKDLAGSLTVGRAAVLHALAASRALAKSDAEGARRLRVVAQELSFDLASFAWPGWDEKGVTIRPSDLEAGLDFARLDVRLVEEMSYPPTKHANARWIVGAQLLAAKRHAEARAEFERALAKAREAKAADQEQMLEGYLGITAAAESPADTSARRRVDAAVAKLRELGTDDAKAYADQLVTALAVFTR